MLIKLCHVDYFTRDVLKQRFFMLVAVYNKRLRIFSFSCGGCMSIIEHLSNKRPPVVINNNYRFIYRFVET